MSDHFVYLSKAGAITLRADGNRLQVTGRFDASIHQATAAGLQPAAAFEGLLRQFADDRFRVLVDTSEEETLVDELPPLSTRDRNALIQKRLALRYRDLRFKTWRPFAVTGEPPKGVNRLLGRRPSAVLIAVMRGESALTPWIQAIEAAKVCLESLHSSALLATELLGPAFKGKTGLLVSLQPGGLRQTLIVRGAVRFSRLAVMRQPITSGWLISETENTIQYLLMSQIIDRDRLRQAFGVWFVPDGLPELAGQHLQLVEGGESAQFTPLSNVLRPLTVVDPDAHPDLASLPLWFARQRDRRTSVGYATRAQRVYASAAVLRSTTRAVSFAVITACLCVTVGLEGYRLIRSDPVSMLKKYQYLISEKQSELDLMKSEYGVSGTELNQITQAADGLRQREVDAVALLRLVSLAIGDETDLRVHRLAWQRAGSEPGAALPVTAAVPGGPPVAGMPSGAASLPGQVQPMAPGAIAGNTAMPSVAPPAGATGNAGERIDARAPDLATQMASELNIEIDGRVPLRIGKGSGNRKVEQLRDQLMERCKCDVQIVRWPHDNKPASTLSGDFLGERATAQAGFEIRARLTAAQGRRMLMASAGDVPAGMQVQAGVTARAER